MAKILCLEDEADIRSDVVEELEDAGHQVLAVANGREGLQEIPGFQPDLIVSDCLMPKMTGLEFFQALRRDLPEFTDTPFMFLSAHADKSQMEKGLQLGADAYLTKPIDFDRLLAMVNSLLSRTAKDKTSER